MRRQFAAALVAGVLAVPGCGDKTLTEGLEEPIAVHDAQFIEGKLPGLPADQQLYAPRPTAATTEVTSLRPSLAGVTFFGWATLDAVSLSAQIEGQGSGYWVVPAGAPDPSVQGEPVRVWRFVADLHDSLLPGRHRLLVAATDAAGRTGSQVASTLCINRPVPDNGNACDPKRPPPEFVISLAWDSPADLDLLVVTPSGEIVASRSPAKGLTADQRIDRNALEKNLPGSGFLDLDSNENCHIDGRQRENVVFQDRPAPGSYLVYVNLHDACHEKAVRYAVSRHSRTLGEAGAGTFSVIETDRTNGTLAAIQANGSTRLGTFVTELIVP
jgi:hypothetical protein